MAHILPDGEGEPFLPRPRAGYTGVFAGGTDPNGVPWCPVDVPSGWSCPRCGHSFAPWVPECRYCPESPAFIAKENDPGPIEMGRP